MDISILENTSDVISRQAAIDAIFSEPLYESGMKKRDADEVVPAIYEKIKTMPPAQPERIKGHWIEITSRNHTYKCSVCGRLLVNITDGKNNVAKNYPYCHCGADMRGGKDGTD